ncbi:MAG: nicotinate phosphoribosyltransferase, partial [Bacteroidota bacterium]
MKSLNIGAGFTDYYQVTMGQAYYMTGDRDTSACFDYYFRKIPFGGGYVIFSGLQNLLDVLEDFSFTSNEIEYLGKQGLN